MEKQKPNITLACCGELRHSGIKAALRKGINEILNCKKRYVQGRQDVPTAERPLKLSFIICTMGTCSGLYDAVESALNQTADKADYEVIAVINGDKEIELPDGVRILREHRIGLSYARNLGGENAAGSILLYMDDDAAADKELVQVMIDTFEKRKRAVIVGGQIETVFPSGSRSVVLEGHEGLWSTYRVPFKKYSKVREQYEMPYGACFAVRYEAFKALGGFPESYGRVGENFAGGEETALCFMAQKKGWEIGIQPMARVEHRIDEKRITLEHVKNTIREGIFTTYRLICDGYTVYNWNLRYISERIKIAESELRRFEEKGERLRYYYKKCEYDAFVELAELQKKREAML